LHILDEEIMECDGLILGSPVYTMAPTGQLKTVCDRFGPTHDVYARLEAKKLNDERGEGPDERSFKNRVGAFISVGGGTKFVYMALPLMNLFTFPLQIKIVDQMQLSGAWYGSVVTHEGAKTLERAGRLGRNVAQSMGKSLSEVKWMGDEPGTCPVCHSNMLIVTDKNPVVCPICGIRGHIRMDGENINVVFPKEEQKISHLTLAGLEGHWKELNSYDKKAKQRSKIESDEELSRKLEKYRGYGESPIR
jgi:NAD(P)H-dependent FMN reductase